MYILVRQGIAYPYSEAQLKEDNPNTSFPKELSEELLATYSVYVCTDEEPPEYDSSIETIQLGEPVLINGSWVRQWTIVPIPVEDLEKQVRFRRDEELSASDWTQTADSPLLGDTSWLTYRTELRDITDQPTFPQSVVWPTEPSSVS
jgi:hypothetical protein